MIWGPPPPEFLEVLIWVCVFFCFPQGLFRKVVTSQVSPWELVRMSTEKLASDDLAQWREKTIKKVCVWVCVLNLMPGLAQNQTVA